MSGPPLVIIACDCFDVTRTSRWLREGKLPALASIVARGCSAITSGAELVAEHGLWVSLFSGEGHAKHGYYSYRQLKPGTYDLHNVSPRDATADPFWATLRGTDKAVAILDAPDMLPVAGLKGIQLANWATHQASNALLGPTSEPAELVDRAREIFGPQIPVLEYQPDSTIEDDRAELRGLMRRIEKKGELLRELLSKSNGAPDLTVLGFFESHTGGHRFWKYRPDGSEGDRWKREAPDLSDAILQLYEAIDRQVGALLTLLPADANVMIVSAFSMGAQYPTTGLTDAFCYDLGYQVSSLSPSPRPGERVGERGLQQRILSSGDEPSRTPLSPALSRGRGEGDKAGISRTSSGCGPIALLRKILPQKLRLAISQRLPLSMQERLVADQFRTGTDWSRTTAFAVPSLYTSFVRVNLKGREPHGIVDASEYDALLHRIEADFRQLIDPVDNQPAVVRITRTRGTLQPDIPQMLPDLFVEWRETNYFMERVIHPRAGELVQRHKLRYHRDSFHTFEGFVAAAGPSIGARGALGEISLLDVAPTMLSLMGQQAPAHLPGKSVAALFTRAGDNGPIRDLGVE